MDVGVDNSPRPSKRARKQFACQRCRFRKQGCDNGYPCCSNCQKAGAECIRPPTSIHSPEISNEGLRERVAHLEARLESIERAPPTAYDRHSPYQISPASGLPRDNDIAEVVGFLSLGADEPTYIGPSSGFPLAANLSEIVQATVWNKVLSGAVSDRAGTMSMAELKNNAADPPNDEMGDRILRAYLTKLHPRYPFLSRNDLILIHKNRFQKVDINLEEQFDLFKLYMVYAIGSTMLKLTELYDYTPPEKFFMTALQYISAARESHSINNVIAMTLLVIYHLRSPSHSGIWYMIGLAMRTCVDLGLHREAHYARLEPFQAELKRRLFWSLYCLENVIAIALGRPCSIADRDIDANLPTDIDDDVEDPIAICNSIDQPQRDHTSTLSHGIHLIKLKRIESEIQYKIYRVDRRLADLIPKISPILQLLEDWKANAPTSSASELTYMMLLYHKAIRLLLQPFINILPPEDPRVALCLDASGQICQTFKRLHSIEPYGHSFVAIHTVFVAGVTICYCLYRNRNLWSFSTANNLRACSAVLYVIAERAPSNRKYRDIFEELVDATTENLGMQDLSEGISSAFGKLKSGAFKQFSDGDVQAIKMLDQMVNCQTFVGGDSSRQEGDGIDIKGPEVT